MSKYILLLITLISTVVFSCKPAAEDRVKMHEKANRISDSIGRVIDAALEEVKIEPKITVDTTKK
jgi:hypothetical protein